MSDELTRLLSETLHSRVDDVESMPDLTARVLSKGRSARTRRRALGWGTTSVVAAAAVVAAALLGPGGQHQPNPAPANSRMPSPTVTSTATSPSKQAQGEDPLMTYAGKLPMGPPIAVIPRAEKRGKSVVVVTADHVVTLPHAGGAYNLTPSKEGLLVSASSEWFTGGDTDPDQALYLIRPDGSLTKLHHGPFHGAAVDPTGKEFAIAEIGERIDAPVHITIGSLSASGKTVSHKEPTATRLLGWTTQGLLLSDTSRVWLWEPGASSQTELPGVVDASVMPTDPGRLLVAAGQTGPSYCLHLFTVRGGQIGPVLTCGSGNGWTVSPDGRRAVFGSTVVDLATGSVGPELMNGLGPSFPHWEDSTHILSPVRGSDPQGQPLPTIWVRCDVTSGACLQAPIPRSSGASAVIDW